MEKKYFGKDKNSNEIFCHTLTDNLGNRLSVINFGATIQSLIIKDKEGKDRDVVLGFDNMEQYLSDEKRTYFGAVCGRVANRIAGGKFTIEGEEYPLAKNAGEACLHGGIDGFDKKFFDLTDAEEDYMTFSAFSEDGEEGFPGNVALSVRYTFRNGLLMIEYLASTTKTCPVNITNHTYFNLDGKGDIKGHSLKLNSSFYLGMNADATSNGMVIPVADSCFDFRSGAILGERIEKAKQLQPSIGGIDHHFFCDNALSEYRKFGTLGDRENFLKMDIFTNQCGAQIYTGNFIPPMVGKGIDLSENSGIAIETQFPPNNLNYSHLPNMLLHRDERYYHKTGFRFYFD
ncbi:MAG: aldose epimerase family protein [Oscillospiraceae bacterium]